MLKNADDLSSVLAVGTTEYFSLAEHKELFMLLQESALSTDPTVESICWKIANANPHSSCSVEYVTKLFLHCPLSVELGSLLETLVEMMQKRRIFEVGKRVIEEMPKATQKSTVLSELYQDSLYGAIIEKTNTSEGLVKSHLNNPSVLKLIEARQEMRMKGEFSFAGLPMHFLDLDKMMSGLQKGHLIIVGARPRVGKTTFALNLIRSMLSKNKVPCAMFSMEMTAQEVCLKLISLISEIPYKSILNGEVGSTDYQKIVTTVKFMETLPLIVDDASGISIEQIRVRAHRLKRRFGVQAIFLDYLQLARTTKRCESRQLEVSEVSRRLKELAKELDLPIVALAQLNRDMEKRAGTKRPILSDLRESGELEAAADEILLLHRPELEDANERPGLIEVFLEKNRYGETGKSILTFRKDVGKMDNYHFENSLGNEKEFKSFGPK